MMNSALLTGCDVFDGDTLHADAALRFVDGVITEVTAAEAAAGAAAIDLGGRLLVPGFIDLQVNGGGGVLFNDAPSVATLRRIVGAHRASGTTACLPTLISDNDDVMRAAIAAVDEAIAAGVAGVIGIHLEGPHLNTARRGVHDAGRIRATGVDALALLTSPRGGKTLVTLAPETVDASFIGGLRDAGVIVCGGHSDATYEQVRAAIDAGLAGFTHLFNAMSPLSSRAPGMVGAALEDPRTFVGVIADGHHVHPASLAIAIRAKARGQTVLVTDAMPTVGSDLTEFTLHGETIYAQDGRCVTGDGTLAGSNIGMIDAVRFLVDRGIVERDEALRMASAYPAAALGIDASHGYLKPGYRADLVALDDDLNVTHSWIGGDLVVFD